VGAAIAVANYLEDGTGEILRYDAGGEFAWSLDVDALVDDVTVAEDGRIWAVSAGSERVQGYTATGQLAWEAPLSPGQVYDMDHGEAGELYTVGRPGLGGPAYALRKLDAEGQEAWTRIHDDPEWADWGLAVATTPAGGALVVGATDNAPPARAVATWYSPDSEVLAEAVFGPEGDSELSAFVDVVISEQGDYAVATGFRTDTVTSELYVVKLAL
jgi:hypothetical protein